MRQRIEAHEVKRGYKSAQYVSFSITVLTDRKIKKVLVQILTFFFLHVILLVKGCRPSQIFKAEGIFRMRKRLSPRTSARKWRQASSSGSRMNAKMQRGGIRL